MSRSARCLERAIPVTLAVALALVVGACSAAGGSPSAAASPSVPAVAPSASPAVAPSPTPFASLIDDEGSAVVLAAEPQRIVSLTPATTEILFALGAGPRVVATTDFDDYPPEAVALPDVASYQAVDVEKIVGLEADLVVAGGNSFNDPTALERLRQLGVPVLVVYAPTIDGVLHDIQLIGDAVGRGEAARDLAAEMRAGFDQVGSAVSGLDRPRVFYELDATSTIYTAAADSFVAEMIERAGGTPITTGSPTDFAIPLEDLIAADPEVIVLGDAAYGVTAEAVAGRAGWAVMTAVREGAIRPADDIVVTRPGPRLVDGLRELARAIHPDADIPVAQP